MTDHPLRRRATDPTDRALVEYGLESSFPNGLIVQVVVWCPGPLSMALRQHMMACLSSFEKVPLVAPTYVETPPPDPSQG